NMGDIAYTKFFFQKQSTGNMQAIFVAKQFVQSSHIGNRLFTQLLAHPINFIRMDACHVTNIMFQTTTSFKRVFEYSIFKYSFECQSRAFRQSKNRGAPGAPLLILYTKSNDNIV